MSHPENMMEKFNTYMITMVNAKIFSLAALFRFIHVLSGIDILAAGKMPGIGVGNLSGLPLLSDAIYGSVKKASGLIYGRLVTANPQGQALTI